MTAVLLGRFDQAGRREKQEIIEALGGIWGGLGDELGEPLPEDLDAGEEPALRSRLGAFLLAAIRTEEQPVAEEAIHVAGGLRVPGAIPVIEARVLSEEFDRVSFMVIGAVESFGGDEACRSLMRISHKESVAKSELLLAFRRLRNPLCVPRLIELLDDREETRHNDKRVCDWAVSALAAIYPDGPGEVYDRDLSKRDQIVARWKAYLAARGRQKK
jgi:HEAT repeat protein